MSGVSFKSQLHTLPIENMITIKCAGIGLNGLIFKKINRNCYIEKNSGSKANPANFYQNWAGSTVLFSWQILNGSPDFLF